MEFLDPTFSNCNVSTDLVVTVAVVVAAGAGPAVERPDVGAGLLSVGFVVVPAGFVVVSAGFMVVTIAKDYFCSKKVTVIKLIGHVVCNIYDQLLESQNKFYNTQK